MTAAQQQSTNASVSSF